MEAKQYVTKQPMDHWINRRRNKNIPGDKWKQKEIIMIRKEINEIERKKIEKINETMI